MKKIEELTPQDFDRDGWAFLGTYKTSNTSETAVHVLRFYTRNENKNLIGTPSISSYLNSHYDPYLSLSDTKTIVELPANSDFVKNKQEVINSSFKQTLLYLLQINPRIAVFIPSCFLKDKTFIKQINEITSMYKWDKANPGTPYTPREFIKNAVEYKIKKIKEISIPIKSPSGNKTSNGRNF